MLFQAAPVINKSKFARNAGWAPLQGLIGPHSSLKIGRTFCYIFRNDKCFLSYPTIMIIQQIKNAEGTLNLEVRQDT